MGIVDDVFSLVVREIPAALAQSALALLGFVIQPYRSVLRLVAFSRRSRIHPTVFVIFAFAMFMLVSGFSRPFTDLPNVSSVVKTTRDLWTHADNKIDVLFVVAYALGLTVLAIFLEHAIARWVWTSSLALFDRFYLIGISFGFVWGCIIGFASFSLSVHFIDKLSISLYGAIVWYLVALAGSFLLATVPLLVFFVQLDRHWYDAASLARKPGSFARRAPTKNPDTLAKRIGRIALAYASSIVFFVLPPAYLVYLAPMLYAGEPLRFTASCFVRDHALLIALSAENTSTQPTHLTTLYIDLGQSGTTQYTMRVGQAVLFDQLKDAVALKPQGVTTLRLRFSPGADDSPWTISDGNWDCSVHMRDTPTSATTLSVRPKLETVP